MTLTFLEVEEIINCSKAIIVRPSTFYFTVGSKKIIWLVQEMYQSVKSSFSSSPDLHGFHPIPSTLTCLSQMTVSANLRIS